MHHIKRKTKMAKVKRELCVACGCCKKVCPRRAVFLKHGVYAHIDPHKCIGCGLCAKECPASVVIICEVAA